MRQILQCLFSPRLYKIYHDGAKDNLYQPNNLERWGDKVIKTAFTFYNIGIYTSPVIIIYLYRRGMYNLDEAKGMGKVLCGLGCLLAFSFILRGIGRAYNGQYMEFLKVLSQSAKDRKEYLTAVRRYDFDFTHWPVNFAVARRPVNYEHNPMQSSVNQDMSVVSHTMLKVVAFLCTHTFALRLIYPGTLSIIHHLLGTALMRGRTELVEDYEGQRAKIATADGNFIDTMFVDRRGKSTNGNTLVICCEGNSGFYEVGIMTTPYKAGYSALGWNHPGFATSTGVPFPNQEQNAMNAVVQYALEELGYKTEDLVFYGWSIGGYTATWAAVQYPECRGLVLDATFDDILPLAERQMPTWWARLVREIIRNYVNLDVASLLVQYRGNVTLIRRTVDEVICLTQGDITTNRANDLVLRLIETRHPSASEEHRAALLHYVGLFDSQRAVVRNTRPQAEEPLRLLSKYMRDYNSSHCTPLPEEYFAEIMRSSDPKRQ